MAESAIDRALDALERACASLREAADSEVRGEHLLALRRIEALEQDNARLREQNDRLGGPTATESERVGYDRAVAVVEAWGREWAAQYDRGYARNEAERVVGTALIALAVKAEERKE